MSGTRHVLRQAASLFLAVIFFGSFCISVSAFAIRSEDGRQASVVVDGQFEVVVPGSWTVGPGAAYVPFCFYFAGSDSFLLATVESTNAELRSFRDNWDFHTRYLEAETRRKYGDLVKNISFDSVGTGEERICVMFLELQDQRRHLQFTAAYRVCGSFTAEYLGVNMGDMPEIAEMTKEAAASFKDLAPAGYGGPPAVYSTGEFYTEPGPWLLPVNNVVALIGEYTRFYFPQTMSEERQATDYVVEWSNPVMEEMARALVEKESGPVYSSDFDRFTNLRIVANRTWDGSGDTTYAFSVEDYGSFSISTSTPAVALDDLQHFKAIKRLHLDMVDITDVQALSQMQSVTYLYLSISPTIEDLSPLGGMINLQELMMWGKDYTKIEDISFFAGLNQLETVYLIVGSVKDAGVFAMLPSLRSLYLNAHDDLNKQPLIECASITTLMLNAESIR